MVRYLGSTRNDVDYNDSNHYGWTAATTGMGHITRDLENIYVFADRHSAANMGNNPLAKRVGRSKLTLIPFNQSQPIQRPLVQTHCAIPVDITGHQDDLYTVTFPTDQLRYASKYEVLPPVIKEANISAVKRGSPKVEFVDLSETSSQPGVGVLVGLEFLNGTNVGLSQNKAQGLVACTIVAHFIPTNMSYQPKTDNVVTIDNPDPYNIVNSSHLMTQAKLITLDFSYLNATNPPIGQSQGKVYEHLLQPLAFEHGGSERPYQYDGSWNKLWPWLVSSVISMQVTDALARLQNEVITYTFCEGCSRPENR